MTTIDPNKTIQKYRREEEMRYALATLINQGHTLHIPPQVEDADIVLSDVIEELLEARKKLALLEPLRNALIEDSAWEEILQNPEAGKKVIEPIAYNFKHIETPIRDAIDTAMTTREEAEKSANAELAKYAEQGYTFTKATIVHTGKAKPQL